MTNEQERRGAITTSDGRDLAWRRFGDGEPLLLVNGYAATADDWDPTFLAHLAERFDVLCPDNRGVGHSALGEPDEVSIDGMAADLEQLLDQAGIESALVAGWSMGGFIVQRFAERAPERVRGLVLMGTDPGGGEGVPCTKEVWSRLTDHGGSPREQASRLISLLFPPEMAAAIDRDFGEIVAEARAKLDPVTLSAQERAMIGWARTPREPAGDDLAPVLIAHGEMDVVIPAANLERLAERYAGAKTELFAGGGHAFMAQEPRRVAELIGELAS